MIIFACPRCGVKQQAPDDAGGKKVACAKCNQRLRVPEPVEMHTLAAVPIQQRIATAPGPASTPAAPKDWYYHQGGKPCGPVSWAELKRMAVEGDLSDEDPIWREGMTEWKAAKTLPNLFSRPKKVVKEGKEGGSRWWEGMGVSLFCGLAGAALLIFVGYIVTRRGKPAEDKGTPAAQMTKDDKGPPKDGERALEPKEIFEKCSPSVARVTNTRGSGSGFLARPGLVVTNSHVVAADLADRLQVTFPSAAGGNKPRKGTLVYEDRTRDLAIVQVDSPLKPLPLAETEAAIGEKVVVIGSPGSLPGMAVENSLTSGELSTRTQLGDRQDWYQISAAINPGNSGGPVFDSHGRVIGVVTLTLRGKQAMNYAVPFPEVVRALKRAQDRPQAALDQLAAEHDAALVYERLGKTLTVCAIGLEQYVNVRSSATRAGLSMDAAALREKPRLTRGIIRALGEILDKPFQNEEMPRVITHRALPVSIRDRLNSLRALFGEMAEWLDNPTRVGFDSKAGELLSRFKRLRNELRLELGMRDDPAPTMDDLRRWGVVP